MNYKTEKVKNKLIKLSEVSILVILGFFLISFGLAAVMATYVPMFAGGFSYIILGLVFLIISFMMKI